MEQDLLFMMFSFAKGLRVTSSLAASNKSLSAIRMPHQLFRHHHTNTDATHISHVH
jgi:hypothetical protein